MHPFAVSLRNLRELRGYTQKQLAKSCGLTESWISHYESGRRKPSLDNLIKLANALRVTLDELVGRKFS